MIVGFSLDSPLVCEGIVGDGCGGGRIFYIDESSLKVYDSTTKESLTLLDGIVDSISIKKTACLISIECKNEVVCFDLSLMNRV